jgi:hypothetical protein
MDYTRLRDYLPLWGLFVATVAVVALSVEGGFQLGKYRRRRSDQEKEAPVGAIVGSTLGLLAFMLAFTFGLAASRFDARRMVVLEESNAIGTSYLRAGLLPAPNSVEIRRLFREYVDVRLQAIQPGATAEAISKSADLHGALWLQATEVAAKDPHSIVTGLFVQSLNEVIDLHSKRVMFALQNRIPELVWLALYFIAILSMAALGYQEGLAGSRRTLAVIALALTFSAVMLLIADLDRPQEGLLRVSQRAMDDLRNSLDAFDATSKIANPGN